MEKFLPSSAGLKFLGNRSLMGAWDKQASQISQLLAGKLACELKTHAHAMQQANDTRLLQSVAITCKFFATSTMTFLPNVSLLLNTQNTS
jgi:hypothetical protein